MDIKGIALSSLSLEELRRLVDGSARPVESGLEPARPAGDNSPCAAPEAGESTLALDPWAGGGARLLPWAPPPPGGVEANARLEATIAFVLEPLR